MNYNVPPGLEYLSTLDKVVVKQHIEVLGLLKGCDLKNKYIIKNSSGQEFFKAIEHTNSCLSRCCGPIRQFEMELRDNMEQEILHLRRPFRCNSWCCPPFTLQTIEVSCPPGNPIGTVNQDWTFCTPFACRFTLQNASGDIVLRIEGPPCTTNYSNAVFKILTSERSGQIGTITKQWSGLCADPNSADSDNFGITFPLDLEVRLKALLLGAMFLIDFMYFEKRP